MRPHKPRPPGATPGPATLKLGIANREHGILTRVISQFLLFPIRYSLFPINRACMPMEATDPCKIGVMGSTPIRSTYEMDGDL